MDILLNWLLQGCLLTASASMTLMFCHRLSATTRYHVWWATLVAVLTLPALPLLVAAMLPAPEQSNSGLGSLYAVTLPPLPRWPLTTVFIVWSIWSGVMLWKGVGAFTRVRGLKQACISFPRDREARLHHWMSIRATGRRVQLVVSDEVRCAAAIGLCAPVIAVAPAVLRELDDEELDRILVHEWAHIQRRDDIARVFQLLVNVLVGFNPAVWWIGLRLELEREVACDDLVIEITGVRTLYAKSLMKLIAVPGRRDLSLVSAALSAPNLTTRILRLLDRRRNISTRRSSVALALASSGLLVLALTLASVKPVTLDAEASQPGPRSDEPFISLSTENVKGRVEPADSAGNALRGLPDPNPLQDTQRQHSVKQEGVRSDSNEPVSDRTERVSRQPMSTMPRQVDEPSLNVNQSAPLAGRPVAIDATPPALVSPDPQSVSLTPLAKSAAGTADGTVPPWSAAASAGTAFGRTSQQAATRTAGFFSRLGKNIGGSF
ncbi:MAG: M56 family metallopeptidase [Vicinamibacterales bacterium]